jgi:hypothetical protein
MNKVDSFSISQESIFKTGSEQEVNNCNLNFFCDIPFGGRLSSVKVCITYMECIPVYPMCVDEIQAMQGFKNSVIWYCFSSHSYWLHISHNLLTVGWMCRWMATILLTEPNFRHICFSILIKMREDLWVWKLSRCLMYITCYLYAVGWLFASRFSWQSLCVLFCMPGIYPENQN